MSSVSMPRGKLSLFRVPPHQELRQHRINVAPALQYHCTRISQARTSTAPAPHQHYINVAPALHHHCTRISQARTSTALAPHRAFWCTLQHCTGTPPALHEQCTGTPPALHRHLISILQAPRQNLTSAHQHRTKHCIITSLAPHQHCTDIDAHHGVLGAVSGATPSTCCFH